ncbi:MAG: TIGR00341 family protein [Candidatus Pacebacteria bacterium]|nr:TIGR00341 family protein [Candidatus Paceibacterota bacterium]MCF7857686.1 TIGR00341 family protein [Candidatus Paceibacterota bacterium]
MPQPITSFFRKLVDLREGAEEKAAIIENVKDDSDFSSARFWTLVFAIGVASVGLNINSIPMVIGAMLISPLMGPVVSIGLALAINDWNLMRRSLRNLLLLTVISISISTLYFALTPISNAQSELLSRTQPTIFDVIVAIFGGIAGFIGISRAKRSTVIPGVAIATALMPPLCTVGYGIGTLQPTFIFGAFYLFLINCIFICLSALLVAKYLKLPHKKYEDEKHQIKIRRIITLIIIVMIIPAVYSAYAFVGKNNFDYHAEQFIKATFEDRGNIVVYKNLSYKGSPHKIELAFFSERFNEDQIAEFQARLSDFGLKNTTLVIKQEGFAPDEEEWMNILKKVQDEKNVQTLEDELKMEKMMSRSPARLLEEAKAINPRIRDIAIGELSYGDVQDIEDNGSLIILVHTVTGAAPFTEAEIETISQWLSARLENENLIVQIIPSMNTTSQNIDETLEAQ